jgi:hypothetical protein
LEGQFWRFKIRGPESACANGLENCEYPSRNAEAVLRRVTRGGSVAVRIAWLAQTSLSCRDLSLM